MSQSIKQHDQSNMLKTCLRIESMKEIIVGNRVNILCNSFFPHSSQVVSPSQSGAPTPTSAPNSPFLPEAPIQFDLMSPKEDNGTVGKSLTGPPKLV